MDEKRRLILEQALALADEQGLAAVSMRAVARRIGLTSMALYPYVGSKQAVLDGLVDVLLAELLAPASAGEGDWRYRLRTVGRAHRALATAHPGAYPLLSLRPSDSGETPRLTELVYAALLAARVPDREVPRLERLISVVLLGYGTAEATGRFAGGAAPPTDADLPAHRRLGGRLIVDVDRDIEFEAALNDLVRLVESHAAR
ncbi:MAG TPA: helix-turn-helix domain-containing protein [Catenuloplanes sp.]|jgi:AcrR family transcriptional regulator